MRVRPIEYRRFTDIQARTLFIIRKPNPIKLSFRIGRLFSSFKDKRVTDPYSKFLDKRFCDILLRGQS